MSPAPLEGTNWTLLEMDAIRVPENAGIELMLTGGRVEGNGGCNRFSGTVRVAGQEIRFEQIASTEMACADPGRMQREVRFLQGLQDARSFDIDGGRLTIHDENDFVRLILRQTFG